MPKASGNTSSSSPSAQLKTRLQTLYREGDYKRLKTEAYQALQTEQSDPVIWTLLGGACYSLKDYGNALEAFRNSLKLKPNDAAAYNNIGRSLQGLGNLNKAIQCFQKALSLNSEYFTAAKNLGDACRKAGALQAAYEAYHHASKLNPNDSSILFSIGSLLIVMQRYREAIKMLSQYTNLVPRNANGWNELAVAYRNDNQIEKAMAYFEKAIEIDSNCMGAISNLGNVYKDLDDFDKSLELQKRALAIRDDLPILHNNYGSALKARGYIREALESFNRANSMERGNDEQHFVRGLLYLTLHDYKNGWPLYEYRRRFKSRVFKRFDPAKEWKGESLEGKSLLIHSEQGIGDTIQFIRFLNHPALANAKCTLAVKSRISHLCSSFETKAKIVTREQAEETADSYDFHCYLMSLPGKLDVSEDEIPYSTPYLFPELSRVDQWSKKLGTKGLKIGINWQGNPSSEIDKGRSVKLATFASLSYVEDVRLISLQKEFGLDQLENQDLLIEDYTNEIDTGDDAFIDTSAIIENLDLVITTDTAIAHLAAALGKPTWVILNHSPDWRWGIEGENSIWYPSVRLFRQKTPGDWDSVFAQITNELTEFSKNREVSK